jgi:hypothetical protein
VLPVSLRLFPDTAAVLAAGDDDDDVGEPELPQAAASNASGTTAAAVATKRILFLTGEISFAPRTGHVRLSSGTLRRARARTGVRIRGIAGGSAGLRAGQGPGSGHQP